MTTPSDPAPGPDAIYDAGVEAAKILTLRMLELGHTQVPKLLEAARAWLRLATGEPGDEPGEHAAAACAHFERARRSLETFAAWREALDETLVLFGAALEGAARGFASSLGEQVREI